MANVFSVNPVILFFQAIAALLLLATTICKGLQWQNPHIDYRELSQRINSWWVMVAMFGVALWFGQTVSIVFFAVLSFIALKEYFSIIPTRRVDRRILFWTYLSIPLQYYWVSIGWYGMFIVFIPVYMLLFVPFRMVLTGDFKNYLRAVGSIHWGLMITVFSISHIAYLLVLPGAENSASTVGAGLVLFLVFLTQINDVAQYIWGKLFGRQPIVPQISPNKTWAGFLGGLLTASMLGALVSPILTPMDALFGALSGALIAAGGFIGDVSISALKRDLGIKDSSQLIPGHGGILDRLDSLTYTAPLFFHLVHYLIF